MKNCFSIFNRGYLKIFVIIFFIIMFLPGFSQSGINQLLYGNFGLSGGNFWGGNIGINFIGNNQISFQSEYSGTVRGSKSTPSDYAIGVTDIFAMGTTTPKDRINSFRLMVGLVRKPGHSQLVRFNLKTGISLVVISTPTNWQKQESFLLVSNYTWDTKSITQAGFVLKPEIEFLFAGFIGIAVSPYCQLTRNFSSAGVGVGLLMGKVQ